MTTPSKLLLLFLTLFGFVRGGLWGALVYYCMGSVLLFVGRFVFSLFGESRGNLFGRASSDEVNASLIELIALVLRADGEVRHSELDYVKQFLLRNYGEEKGREYLLRLRDLVKPDARIDLASVTRKVASNTNYVTRYHLVDFLFGLAAADGSFSPVEQRVLQQIATGLGINNSDYLSMLARHAPSSFYGSYTGWGGQSQRGYSGGWGGYANSGGGYAGQNAYAPPKTDPYKVLGLDSSATDDEVKKAYRSLAKKYHPDKVEGMGEEVKKASADQFRKINEAYEQIKSARSMK